MKRTLCHMLLKEFGLRGLFSVSFQGYRHLKRIRREHRKEGLPTRLLSLTALFYAIAGIKGRRFASEFLRNLLLKTEVCPDRVLSCIGELASYSRLANTYPKPD